MAGKKGRNFLSNIFFGVGKFNLPEKVYRIRHMKSVINWASSRSSERAQWVFTKKHPPKIGMTVSSSNTHIQCLGMTVSIILPSTVFSEEEPDLNNELEISVSKKKISCFSNMLYLLCCHKFVILKVRTVVNYD